MVGVDAVVPKLGELCPGGPPVGLPVVHVDVSVRHELLAAHDMRDLLMFGEDFNSVPERLQTFAMHSFFLWFGPR